MSKTFELQITINDTFFPSLLNALKEITKRIENDEYLIENGIHKIYEDSYDSIHDKEEHNGNYIAILKSI